MKCPICDRPVRDGAPRCHHCGADFVDLMEHRPAPAQAPAEAYEPAGPTAEDAKAAAVILTTASAIDGYRVAKTIDIVAAECLLHWNLVADLVGSIRTMRTARSQCLTDLRRAAVALGANAVIGVDLDYSEFAAAGKSVLFLMASGTAVLVEEIDE